MANEKSVFVKCRLSRSALPHERIFVIDAGNEMEFRGVAPAHYCFKTDQTPLSEEPLRGAEVAGLLPAMEIGRTKSGLFRVYLPDGEVYDLRPNVLEPIPAGGPLLLAVRD